MTEILPNTNITDHRKRRRTGIIESLVTGLGGRAITLVVGFLSVPLTIGYLGAERYGAWIAIGSLLTWLQLADLGAGNGLTNAIGAARGSERNEDVKVHVSNTFFFLLATSAIAGLVAALSWRWINWSEVFGLRTQLGKAEVGPSVAIALAIFLLQIPLAVISRVLVAYQEGKLANYWSVGSNFLSLAALLAVTRTHGGLPLLVLAISGAGLVVNVVCGLWLFLLHKPFLAPSIKSISIKEAKGMGETSGKFFLIQILGLITFQTDNLIIAHFRGSAEVTPYSVTYKLFGYTSIIQTLAFSHVWAAYSEAIARKDIEWVRRTFRFNLWSSVAITILVATPLVPFARPLILLWAGKSAVPAGSLVLWMLAWSVINAFTSPIACLLAAASHLTAQTIYSSIACAANITLSIIWVRFWGGTGVIAATVIAYSIFICGPCFVDVNRLLKRLAQRM